MYTGLFNVFLNAGYYTTRLVRQRVDVEFRSLLEKLVDLYWAIRTYADGRAYVMVQALIVIDDRHCTSAQHVTRSQQHWIAETSCNLFGFLGGCGAVIFRLWNSQLADQRTESRSILSEIDRVGRGADDGHSGSM